MGLFDEIQWDAQLPPGHPPNSRLFQTKCLDSPCLDRFVVTPEGRLLLVGSGWGHSNPNLAPIEVAFHGDMILVAPEVRDVYVARFTHGKLEWIRPLADGEPDSVVMAAKAKLMQAQSKADSERG